MSELSERLRAATGGQSIDDVAYTLAAAGHKLGRNTVAKFLRGDHGPRPTEKVLRAFAAGYGLDVGELRELAGRPRGELDPWVPPDEAASLTKGQRDAMDQLIREVVKGGGRSDSGQDEDQKSLSDNVVAPDVWQQEHPGMRDRAARKGQIERPGDDGDEG